MRSILFSKQTLKICEIRKRINIIYAQSTLTDLIWGFVLLLKRTWKLISGVGFWVKEYKSAMKQRNNVMTEKKTKKRKAKRV